MKKNQNKKFELAVRHSFLLYVYLTVTVFDKKTLIFILLSKSLPKVNKYMSTVPPMKIIGDDLLYDLLESWANATALKI
jgi:hypothetical protein